LEFLYPRCCGLDVQQKTVVACLITPGGKEIRTFKTMTSDLLQLADWIIAKGVTHVAMESTGVYWRPVYNVLEALDLTLLAMNAQHIKTVPGRIG
jgi:transposase